MDNKIKIGIGAGVVALIIAGGGYYCLNANQRTPDYAIETLEQAIENHDTKSFYDVVDLDGVLNTSYDGLVEGLTDVDKSMSNDAKDAVKNFTQMMKAPLLSSLKTAIESYVATGAFNESKDTGVSELLKRAGIDRIEYRGVDGVEINSDFDEAVASVRIYQPEIGREFVLKAVLNQNELGRWQFVRLENFGDFMSQITAVRRAQLERYLEKTAEINSRHDKTISEAEQKYSSLAIGGIGQSNTRSELKNLMLDVIKKDWEVRRQELFGLSVPAAAGSLQNLYMKICDLEIGYAEDYARWMEDRKATTIKFAEEKQRQAQTLRAEAAEVSRRFTAGAE